MNNGKDSEDPEFKEVKTEIKMSTKYTPEHPSDILVTRKLAEQLGIGDDQPIVIEHIAQDPKTLNWEDL